MILIAQFYARYTPTIEESRLRAAGERLLTFADRNENLGSGLLILVMVSLLSARSMTRPLRIEYAGAHYHVTSRGNERWAIFRDDTDRELFLLTSGSSRSNRSTAELVLSSVEGLGSSRAAVRPFQVQSSGPGLFESFNRWRSGS
jgi:hypothetical protein